MGVMSRLYGAGKAATKMYQADVEAKKAARDRPPPARRAKPPGTPSNQGSPQGKANRAADALNIPGRETARRAGNRTARELEKLGL
jgi:hypothetical protein